MLSSTLTYGQLISNIQRGTRYPDIPSLGIFKGLATIEFQLSFSVGKSPPAHHISAAKKVLKASEHSGRKVIKLRVLRISYDWYEYLGVENLDIIVA